MLAAQLYLKKQKQQQAFFVSILELTNYFYKIKIPHAIRISQASPKTAIKVR